MQLYNGRAVQGKWRYILATSGIPESFLKNRHGPCPLCGGTDRFRFDDREGRGSYYCNSCGPGDGMDLLIQYHNMTFKEASDMVAGLAPEATTAVQPAKRDATELLRRMWKFSKPVTPGDMVCEYLNNREVLPTSIPEDLRFHPDLRYYEEGKHVGTYPAMLALVRDPQGKPKTLHVTYLKDGKKAQVSVQKKVISELGDGAAIRLFEPTKGQIAIAEGIETALAVRNKFGVPVWATISAGGMKDFACPADVKTVFIYADNDTNFVGQEAAYSLARRLHREGLHVDVFVPKIGGRDWADGKDCE